MNGIPKPRAPGYMSTVVHHAPTNIQPESARIAPQDSQGPESRLLAAAQAGRMGIWEYDFQTGLLTASAMFMQNLGLPPGDTLTWEQLQAAIHPQDLPRKHAALAHAIATGAEFEIEYRVMRPGGTMGWLHKRAAIERAPDGTPLRIAGISFDVTDRHAAQLRIEVSEESLRLAADAADIGTWDADLIGDTLSWSDRTRAMFGLHSGRTVTLADFYAGLHPDDLPATRDAFASALDPAIRATYDVEYRTVGLEDGKLRWVAAKGRGLFSGDVCRRAIGTAIDITARKQAELRQAFVLDLMDRLRHLSDPGEILRTAGTALGAHLGAARVGFGRVQPDDATVVLETCYVSGVAPLNGPFPLHGFGERSIAARRRGHTVAVDDVEADPFNDPAVWAGIDTRAYVSVPLIRDGQFRASLFVNHRDVHAWAPHELALIEDVASRTWDSLERARAEESLRHVNAVLERQVETRTREFDRIWRLSPVVMVVGDTAGILLEVNPAWSTVLGWTPAETVGHDVMEFVAPEDREVGAAGMAQLFAGIPVIEYQNTFQTKSGGRRRIAWTTVPEGKRLYGFGRDITDQMEAEERLRQAQKMEAVGQLTGGLAHDFNNLLTGISGSLEFVQARVRQGRVKDIDRYIDAAQGAARRAAALTQRLLAFSRRQTLDARPTNVNALIEGMQELIDRTVGPALELQVITEPEIWTTLVDPHQLENSLLNLCINARDAMPDGGLIKIETANHDLTEAAAKTLDLAPGQYIWLSVTDTGTGMPPDVLSRAFDPFFTTKPLGVGTGLGLSMIYGFARQSGGQVRLLSEPGHGTTVCLYLPRHEGQPVAAPAAASQLPPPRAEQGETVLVVDDETTVRMLVTEVLNELGYTTIEAADGAAGLRILQSGARVDLLVTDVGLPGGVNGRQLADAARALRPELRVLFITGYAEKAVMAATPLEPGMHLLTKPFSLETLAARIKQLIDT
jgi:PAS domain S-box-containing protein